MEVFIIIKYDKLLKLLQDRGYTSYTVKKSGLMGQETYRQLLAGGGITIRTLDKLCAELKCQPGELIEYVEEVNNGENAHKENQG